MQGTWRELNDLAPAGSPDYLAWRQTLLDSLARLPQDSVVFSHFIAINVAVAAAHARDDVVCFRPDHASITCVEAGNGSVAAGRTWSPSGHDGSGAGVTFRGQNRKLSGVPQSGPSTVLSACSGSFATVRSRVSQLPHGLKCQYAVSRDCAT